MSIFILAKGCVSLCKKVDEAYHAGEVVVFLQHWKKGSLRAV